MVAGVIALCFLLLAGKSPAVKTMEVVKGAPWAIVFLLIGIYVVVYGLRNAGLTDVLAELINTVAGHGLFAATMGMGFLASWRTYFKTGIVLTIPTLFITLLGLYLTLKLT